MLLTNPYEFEGFTLFPNDSVFKHAWPPAPETRENLRRFIEILKRIEKNTNVPIPDSISVTHGERGYFTMASLKDEITRKSKTLLVLDNSLYTHSDLFTPDELEAMLLHEIGHAQSGDLHRESLSDWASILGFITSRLTHDYERDSEKFMRDTAARFPNIHDFFHTLQVIHEAFQDSFKPLQTYLDTPPVNETEVLKLLYKDRKLTHNLRDLRVGLDALYPEFSIFKDAYPKNDEFVAIPEKEKKLNPELFKTAYERHLKPMQKALQQLVNFIVTVERASEFKADDYSILHGGKPEALISGIEKMAKYACRKDRSPDYGTEMPPAPAQRAERIRRVARAKAAVENSLGTADEETIMRAVNETPAKKPYQRPVPKEPFTRPSQRPIALLS